LDSQLVCLLVFISFFSIGLIKNNFLILISIGEAFPFYFFLLAFLFILSGVMPSHFLLFQVLEIFSLFFFLNSAFYNFFYYLMVNYFDSQLIDIQFDVIKEGLNSNSVLSSSEQQSAWKISKEELYSHVKAKTILFSYVQGLPAGFLLSMLFAYIFKKD